MSLPGALISTAVAPKLENDEIASVLVIEATEITLSTALFTG